jgi:folate-binding protein YgfZ
MAVVLDRATFRASGRDTRAYLQSMLTQDVEAIPDGWGAYALLLTPKARVIADVEVFAVDGTLFLALPPAVADDAVRTLEMARFRKKVVFEPAPEVVVWQGDAGLAEFATPAGTLVLAARAPARPEPADRWQVARVEAGMPEFGTDFDGSSMPAEAGLEDRAISFTKGCYPGQEPVARLHYRGHANRGPRGLRHAGKPPAPGTPVVQDGREVGRTGSAAVSERFGPIGLAVLRREVADGAVVVAGGAATVTALPFAYDSQSPTA